MILKKKDVEHLKFVLMDCTYASIKSRIGLRNLEKVALYALARITTKAEYRRELKRYEKYKAEAWPKG